MVGTMPVEEFRRWLGRDSRRYSDDDLWAALEDTKPGEQVKASPAGGFAEHDFASTQFDLPDDIAEQIRDFAASLPSEDVLEIEENSHVTLLGGM